MADRTNAVTGPKPEDIHHLASEIQSKLYHAEYLLEALDGSAEEAEREGDLQARIRASDKIMVFCQLAQAAIVEARTLAEAVETASLPPRPNRQRAVEG